jgi:hypothetical protein
MVLIMRTLTFGDNRCYAPSQGSEELNGQRWRNGSVTSFSLRVPSEGHNKPIN